MARDIEALREQLRKHGPWWLREPDVVADSVLYAVAAVFAEVERVIDLLHGRTFIEVADGAWLDVHGRERRVYRLLGETDAAYRPRLTAIEDVVTKPAIIFGVDSILLVPGARLEEHIADGAFACNDGAPDPADPLTLGFADNCSAFDFERSFTVFVPEQLPSTNDTAFAIAQGAGTSPESFAVENTGDGAWPDDPGAFADQTDPTRGDIYARIWAQIDRLRAAGVSFRVEIE